MNLVVSYQNQDLKNLFRKHCPQHFVFFFQAPRSPATSLPGCVSVVSHGGRFHRSSAITLRIPNGILTPDSSLTYTIIISRKNKCFGRSFHDFFRLSQNHLTSGRRRGVQPVCKVILEFGQANKSGCVSAHCPVSLNSRFHEFPPSCRYRIRDQ